MVVLNRIYTRSGDGGDSALASGERRRKSDVRFEAIGTVDELNATLGLVAAPLPGELPAMLKRIQNDLFDLGADLATPERAEARERLRINDAQVERLEREIDALNAELAPLTSFVLPGGRPAAAALHLSRTVARRAERVAIALAAEESVNGAALRYLNRLSDFLFVAARFVNGKGADDVLWVPGQNR